MRTVQHVVVTGASSGIGLAIAERLVRDGVRVFAGVRRQADADRLRARLGDRLAALQFDVTDAGAIAAAASTVRERLSGRTLDGLVNNAGIAIGGPLLHQDLDEVRRHFEVNVLGVLRVTRAFAPLLGTDRSLAGLPGRIVNMSSGSGIRAMPFIGAYAASKHALEGLTEAMRRELIPFGIDAIIIGPVQIATPIWEKAESLDPARYDQTEYAPVLRRVATMMIERGKAGLPPSDVAGAVVQALTSDRPRVRYAVVRHPLRDWATRALVPRRLMDSLLARRLGLQPRREVG